MRRIVAVTALCGALGFAAPALGQSMSAVPSATPQVCAAMDANLPAPLAPWTAKTDLAAAKDQKGLAAAALTPGKAVSAALPSTAQLKFITQPEKPGGSVSHGGLFSFKIEEARTYRVALSTAAWIDVLEGGRPVVSTDHGHGPECSTLRKIVDFPLKAGAHVLQISANAEPKIGVLIIRK